MATTNENGIMLDEYQRKVLTFVPMKAASCGASLQ
jgi:hypothetical protein